MERAISDLVRDFEERKIDREQLIQSLVEMTLEPKGDSAFQTVSVDHISYQVSDYARTRDFYASLMGMKVTNDNGSSQCQLHIPSGGFITARNFKTPGRTEPIVDHISYKIADWDTDRVRDELERRGMTPRLDTGGGDGYASFHVEDPDGYDLQISGDVRDGDALTRERS